MVVESIPNLPMLLLLAGLVLGIAEAVVPGVQFIVVGTALFLAGVVGVLFPPAGNAFVLAGLTLLFGIGGFYAYNSLASTNNSEDSGTKDASSLKGLEGITTEEVTPNSGRVKLTDGGFNPYYEARTITGTIPEGEEVIVTDPGGGSVVTVAELSSTSELERELERETA